MLCEGEIIQSLIGKLSSTDPPDKSTKLGLEGQANSALRFLSESTSARVLSYGTTTAKALQSKTS